MCGIGGQFLHDPKSPSPATLDWISEAMRYRGPDDAGCFRAAHIGLVHRRLSIRDLTAAGRCPMASPDGLVQVLLNGEIYNWRELREELCVDGYHFQSNSDTEVLLNGYRAWRCDVVQRLRGMFALAIWDGTRRQLLLARDRVGEKPLYYGDDSRGLAFASSLQALRVVLPGSVINEDAMACYLSHSFVPASHTVWRGAKVLPPAHILTISPGEPVKLRRYWELPRQAPVATNLRKAERSFERIVDDSVERCLDADVPVGVFLSGGVDSSLVAALAARRSPGLPAFSLGFRESDYSELPYARLVARHIGAEHHEIEVDVDDLVGCLPHLVEQYGQPFGDASAVPTFLLSTLARKYVKVCLSGDGGDEVFGGYWRMQSTVYALRYARLVPEALRRGIVPVIAARLGQLGGRWDALNTLSLSAGATAYSNYESWFLSLGDVAGPRLLEGLRHDIVACRSGSAARRFEASLVQQVLLEDFQVQLPDDYLTKVDVASMAASLEVRAPLLDQRVLEQAWVLPDRAKLNYGRRKWLLKRIAAQLVPKPVVYRQKMGFALPLEHWWRQELGDWLSQLMKDSVAVADGWIRREPIDIALDRHRQGESHHTRLWLALWLELWFRLVVQGQDAERVLPEGHKRVEHRWGL